MSPLNDKKSSWIGRDADGRLCLFRRLPKQYSSYKIYKREKEVVEVCEQEEREYFYENDCSDPNDGPRHRAREDKYKKEEHQGRAYDRNYDRHRKPSPKIPTSPKPILKKVPGPPPFIPVVDPAPRVEVRRPRHRSPSPTPSIRFPCTPTLRFRDIFGSSPTASPGPPLGPKKPTPPSAGSPRVYHIADPHVKLEKIPVHKLYKVGRVNPVRLEKVKLERLTPTQVNYLDLDKLSLRSDRDERDRRRTHCDIYESENDHYLSDEEEIGGHAGTPRAHLQRRRSYSRNRVVQEERATWDEDLDAFVIKRVPEVRFE